jgi:hypothetical protein
MPSDGKSSYCLWQGELKIPFLSTVTQWMLLVKQELLILPEQLSSTSHPLFFYMKQILKFTFIIVFFLDVFGFIFARFDHFNHVFVIVT